MNDSWLAQEILERYNFEAENYKWSHYGIKITHFLQEPCFDVMFPIFNEKWPDAKYIVVLRNPYEVVLSTLNDRSWDTGMIMASYRSAMKGLMKLMGEKLITILCFPFCFETQIAIAISNIGLEVKEEALTLFDLNKIKSKFDPKSDAFLEFKERYSEEIKSYKSICFGGVRRNIF